ncbi:MULTISPECIES: hypothetical protein [unclassified Streptomyces]|uniref:hypothetical protein n=1 Tax=unclassified Streptomyces TaxID=2593676 RepID=UPI000BEF6D8A|nr:MULTISPECIES: hypothetical protein [unclassified Streptomyces]
MTDTTAVVPLWETDHPYYAAEGNFYKPGLHNLFESWVDFTETTFFRGDRDMNLLYRWDWQKASSDSEDDSETLKLFFILQRKAIACSAEMPITTADESAVRAWLTECANAMRATWEPLLPIPAA